MDKYVTSTQIIPQGSFTNVILETRVLSVVYVFVPSPNVRQSTK